MRTLRDTIPSGWHEQLLLVSARELAGARRPRNVLKALLMDPQPEEVAHVLVDECSQVGDGAVESGNAVMCARGTAVDLLSHPLRRADDLALIGVLLVNCLQPGFDAVEANKHYCGEVGNVGPDSRSKLLGAFDERGDSEMPGM